MSIEKNIPCLMIFLGAIIMLVSILKSKDLLKAMPYVPKRHRQELGRRLELHRLMMVFFLFGYIVVLLVFAFEISLVSRLFVSVIFLVGAVFVLLGTYIQSRLLAEMQTTLTGLLPICAKCKKIRIKEGDAKDSKSWKSIEAYISEKSGVHFSHGLCPECFKNEMMAISKKKARQCA